MSLAALISDIKKDQKISSETLISILTEAVENEDDSVCTYKMIYKKAYGNKLNETMARDWVNKLESGQKWTMEQTSEVGHRVGVDWNKISKIEFWACMNAFYSDFTRTAKKYELLDEPEFFGDIVWDYFNDDDAHDKCPLNYYFSFVA